MSNDLYESWLYSWYPKWFVYAVRVWVAGVSLATLAAIGTFIVVVFVRPRLLRGS